MPIYTYRGRNVRTNESLSGERFSNSAQALAAVLRREQIAPIAIRRKKTLESNFLSARKCLNPKSRFFYHSFVMLDAGLPLVQALDAIAQQHPNKDFKTILEQIRSDVESGTTLSAAMAPTRKFLTPCCTNMVAAGETGGILDTILQRLCSFIEKIVKLKRALRSAMIYPSTILTIAVGVVIVILWKVVPVFSTLFEGFNVELPLPTRFVIALSGLVERYMIFLIILAGIAAFGLRSYNQTDKGRRVVDKTLLKLPILGDVLRKIGVARFTRTLATLLTSGVPILEALGITAKTCRECYPGRHHLSGAAQDRRGRHYGRTDAAIRLLPADGDANGFRR